MGFLTQQVFFVARVIWCCTCEIKRFVTNPVTLCSTKQLKPVYKGVKIAPLHQEMCFYITFAFVNTIG